MRTGLTLLIVAALPLVLAAGAWAQVLDPVPPDPVPPGQGPDPGPDPVPDTSTVTVSPVPVNGRLTAPGIDCGTGGTGDCTESYPWFTSVVLAAVPASGFQIGAWTGCYSVSGAQCTLTATGSPIVSVTFTPIQFSLTVGTAGSGAGEVTSSPAGITCPADCTEPYDSGTLVTLSAMPAVTPAIFPGSRHELAGWSGCDSVSGTTCTVTMNAPRSVTATFVVFHQFVVQPSAGGRVTAPGIDCGTGSAGDCFDEYEGGSTVTLTATPASGFQVGAWTGCDSATGAQCTVTMNAPGGVSVSFVPVTTTVTLTVSPVPANGRITGPGIDCGTGSTNDCVESYAGGTTVTLTATPAPGYVLQDWSGCPYAVILIYPPPPPPRECVLDMTTSRTLSATFTPSPTTVELNVALAGTGLGGVGSTPGGISCPPDCSEAYPRGTGVTLTAAPIVMIGIAPGSTHEFAGWSGCDVALGPTCKVGMDGPRSVTATFLARRLLGVTVGLGGQVRGPGIECGSGSTGDCIEEYASGTTATLTAIPASPTHVPVWTGCGSVSGAQCTVTMSSPRMVSVAFVVVDVFPVVELSRDARLTNPGPLAADDTHLYVGNGTEILVLPLGGGPVTTLYANATPCCVVGLTRVGTDLFWIDPNGDPDATAIWRAPAAGGAPPTKIYSGFATGQPIVDGVGLASDGVALYTVDEVNGRVHRLTPEGSGITELGRRYGGFFDQEHFQAIAESGGTLYVVDQGCTCPGGTFAPAVVAIPASGGAFTTLWTGPPLVRPSGIAVGNGAIFVADPGAGNTIWRLPLAGGAPTALVSGPPFVELSGILLHGDLLYVTDTGNSGGVDGPGAIYRIDPRALQSFRLTISPVPMNGSVAGPGIDCGAGTTGDCEETYSGANPVTLVASPAAGFEVATWVGCDSASGEQCTVTMSAARTVSVTFVPVRYQLGVSLSGAAGQQVVSSPAGIGCPTTCSATFDAGTVVTLTVTPAGSTVQWSGCDSAAGPRCKVRMDGPRSVLAISAVPWVNE